MANSPKEVQVKSRIKACSQRMGSVKLFLATKLIDLTPDAVSHTGAVLERTLEVTTRAGCVAFFFVGNTHHAVTIGDATVERLFTIRDGARVITREHLGVGALVKGLGLFLGDLWLGWLGAFGV